jgi:hypothetical protein
VAEAPEFGDRTTTELSDKDLGALPLSTIKMAEFDGMLVKGMNESLNETPETPLPTFENDISVMSK